MFPIIFFIRSIENATKALCSTPHFGKKNVNIAAVTLISVGILIRVYKGIGEPIRAIWLDSEGCKCISQFIS